VTSVATTETADRVPVAIATESFRRGSRLLHASCTYCPTIHVFAGGRAVDPPRLGTRWALCGGGTLDLALDAAKR